MNKINIPKGWHRVRSGILLRKGDKFYDPPTKRWTETQRYGCTHHALYFYIRKYSKKKPLTRKRARV